MRKKGSYENVAKLRARKKSSSTPGKEKNKNCQKSDAKRRYCADSRWYRTDPNGYASACAEVDKLQ